MAELGVVWHGIQSCEQLVANSSIQLIFHALNLAGKFVLLERKTRSFFLMHGKLKIYKFLHVFLKLIRILVHQLFQSFAFCIFDHNGPLAIDLSYLQNLRDIQSAFLYASLAESLIKDICLSVLFGKYPPFSYLNSFP